MNRDILKKESTRRWLTLIFSQLIMGFGIAFTRHAGLGVSPNSSVPHVLSLYNQFLSFGMWSFVWNMLLVVIQLIILRRSFKTFSLLQIPLTFVLSVFTDIGVIIAGRFPTEEYSFKLMCVAIGTVILAFGISIGVCTELVIPPGEATVKAISDKSGIQYGNAKIIFDIACVVISIMVSLLLFDMNIVGAREGTVISAACTGFFVKLMIPLIKDDLTKWFRSGDER